MAEQLSDLNWRDATLGLEQLCKVLCPTRTVLLGCEQKASLLVPEALCWLAVRLPELRQDLVGSMRIPLTHGGLHLCHGAVLMTLEVSCSRG